MKRLRRVSVALLASAVFASVASAVPVEMGPIVSPIDLGSVIDETSAFGSTALVLVLPIMLAFAVVWRVWGRVKSAI